MKRLIVVPLMILVTIGLISLPYVEAASEKPMELKAVTFLPRQTFSVKSIFPLIDRINAQAKRKITIKYLGGPEVIPPPQQAEAVRNNVVQISLCPVEYYEALVKLGNMMLLSMLSPDEEYKSGAYKYINELHGKAGLHYVGRATAMSKPQYFWMITNKKIKRPQELAGQKIGASSTWPAPFLKAVGATPVLLPVPEFYTGLERGVVDGAADPLTNFMTFQLYEVCKYVIEPGVFAGGLVMIMNLGTWNKLPEDMKKLITDVGAEVLREYTVDMDKEVLKAKKTAQEKGMEIIRFAPEDEKWFVNTFYEASWNENIRKYPDIAPKMKKLMSRDSLR